MLPSFEKRHNMMVAKFEDLGFLMQRIPRFREDDYVLENLNSNNVLLAVNNWEDDQRWVDGLDEVGPLNIRKV